MIYKIYKKFKPIIKSIIIHDGFKFCKISLISNEEIEQTQDEINYMSHEMFSWKDSYKISSISQK